MSNEIRVETVEGKVAVTAPYVTEWPGKARKIGGRWDAASKTWQFDQRDEARARDLVRETYGWSEGAGSTVDVKITARRDLEADRDAIRVAGRTVVRATSRDSGAQLGEGVVDLGARYHSGGSRQYWATTTREGSAFEVRDLPADAVALIDERDWTVEIVSGAEEAAADRQRRIEAVHSEIAALGLTVEDLFPAATREAA